MIMIKISLDSYDSLRDRTEHNPALQRIRFCSASLRKTEPLSLALSRKLFQIKKLSIKDRKEKRGDIETKRS